MEKIPAKLHHAGTRRPNAHKEDGVRTPVTEIPILMVVLSLVLRRGLNRALNFFAVPATIVMIVMENLNPDLDNIFFMTVQISALLVVLRIVWVWKEEKPV